MDDYLQMARAVRRLVENAAGSPDLAGLAREAGLSPAHFQRKFTRWVGISPKRFQQCLALAEARLALAEGLKVEEAAWRAGLSGSGRLHDLCVLLEAATPGEIRRGGLGMPVRYGYAPTPFGECLLALSPRGICHLAFVDEGRREVALAALAGQWPAAELSRDDAAALGQVRRIFTPSPRRGGTLKVLVKGTEFQVRVWRALLQIPEGTLVSYGSLARSLGNTGAARAVGTAVGANSLACLIPCHRVVRGTGATGGYRWGEWRKKALIAREMAQSAHPIPSRRPRVPA